MLRFALGIICGAEAVNNHFNFPNVQGLQKFSASKFGLFIHWGPVSQWGTEISFPLTCTSLPCDTSGPGNSRIVINTTEQLIAHRNAYAALAQTFNPTAFNATALVDLAYSAGFRYLTWVGTHCDGFSNWDSTANHAYSIMSTPFAKDTCRAMVDASRARGLRPGVYVCPSFWNRDDYFYPAANSSFGTCCQPNYAPSALPGPWSSFTSYLHNELADLAQKYQPDHYWLDSGTYPPSVDTHIEEILPTLRAANPDAVVQVRDGGVWKDYVETDDHSEDDAHSLMGVSQIRPGTLGVPTIAGLEGGVWEVPGTLGQQWAYDPHAQYESAEVVVRKLIGVVSKGGNFLLNIGLDSTGVWAPAAVSVLQGLSAWMSYNSEAIYNTTASFPYEYYNGPLDGDNGLTLTQYFTASLLQDTTYVFLVDSGSATISANSSIIVPTYKPSVLSSVPQAVSLLTSTGAKALTYTLNETGLVIPASEVLQPAPVLLGTYFYNYSAHNDEDEGSQGVRRWSERVSPAWPREWWEEQKGKSSGVDAGQATGSRSAQRKKYGHLYGVPKLTTPVHVDNAPCATRACSVYTAAGYVLTNAEGVCYRSSLLPGGEPAVQLQLWYNNALDNMGSPLAPVDGQTWQDVDAECWLYAGPGSTPGARLPVEVWHNAALGDYWTLASAPSRASAQAQGYTLYASLGYMDPVHASGQLTDRQVQDATADYAYVLRLDW